MSENNYENRNNDVSPELNSANETEAVSENLTLKTEVNVGTPSDAETNVEETDGTQRKKANGNNTKRTGAAVISTVVAAVFVVITMIGIGSSNFSVNFSNLEVFGTSFRYSLNVLFDYELDDNATIDFADVDTGLRLVVVNSTDSQTVELSTKNEDVTCAVAVSDTDDKSKYSLSYTFAGEVKNLKEGTRYMVQVIGDDNGATKIYSSQEIKTQGGLVTSFDSVSYQCQCQVNDTFLFDMSFVDENNFYSDFTYSILNADGTPTVYTDIRISDPHAQQVVSGVADLHDKNYVLEINYFSTAYSDTEDITGQTKIQKTYKVDIII